MVRTVFFQGHALQLQNVLSLNVLVGSSVADICAANNRMKLFLQHQSLSYAFPTQPSYFNFTHQMPLFTSCHRLLISAYQVNCATISWHASSSSCTSPPWRRHRLILRKRHPNIMNQDTRLI
eukprot:812444_1